VFIAPVVKLRFKLFTRPPSVRQQKAHKDYFCCLCLESQFFGHPNTFFFIIGRRPKNPRTSAFRK